MDVSVEIVGLEAIRDYLDDMPDELFDETKKTFAEVAADVHKKVSNRVRNGTPLHSRTGQLRRSLKFKVYGTKLADLGANVFSEKSIAPYALVHEKGATGANAITAKKAYRNVPGGPYLNIPTQFNQTASGVMRLPAREVFNQGGYIAMSKKGRYFVFLEGLPMFTLVKSVSIPARLEMVKTGEREVPTLLSLLSQSTQRAIK